MNKKIDFKEKLEILNSIKDQNHKSFKNRNSTKNNISNSIAILNKNLTLSYKDIHSTVKATLNNLYEQGSLNNSHSYTNSSRNLDFDLENDFCLTDINCRNLKSQIKLDKISRINFDNINTTNSTSFKSKIKSDNTVKKLHLNLDNIQTASFNEEFFKYENSFSPSWRNACN